MHTHLVGPPVTSPLLFATYDEQQYEEILALFELVTSKDVPILMGDFNNGPAPPGGITWEFPFHYGLISARGFFSPYLLEDGRCTFCADNPSVAAASFFASVIIDHIYLTIPMVQKRLISSKVVYQ